MAIVLEVEGLLLRDFSAGEFDAFFRTTQDEEYRRYYSEAEMARSHWKGIFEGILDSAGAEARSSYQLAICQLDGEIIGTCGVRMEEGIHQQASFGCAIGRPFWGMGAAYKASRRLLEFAFATLPVHRIYAETISENLRARALAERLGMRLEGELRHTRYFRGRWWDTAVYSILRDEWQGG